LRGLIIAMQSVNQHSFALGTFMPTAVSSGLSLLRSWIEATFTPRAGSSTSVILEAQRPQSHKCNVCRWGCSSKGAHFSSLAATEIETTSNWNNRPSENECSGRLQPSFAQYASI
jgi:hypothetical protein